MEDFKLKQLRSRARYYLFPTAHDGSELVHFRLDTTQPSTIANILNLLQITKRQTIDTHDSRDEV